MFFFRHPKPIIDGRAVAVQVVQQKVTRDAAPNVLIVETTTPQVEHPATVEPKLPV